MNNFVETEHLSFSYNEDNDRQIPALEDVSIQVKDGEYGAILGHNGSGKSTFAKLLNMILSPDAGIIRIAGREVTAPDFTEDDMFDVRREVGMVFQNPDNQLVATVVEEDVAFGPENLGVPREEIRQRVDAALAMVGMSAYAQHAPHRLSGGQKQRIAIAGMIAMMPKCIIFDEATASLDSISESKIQEAIDPIIHSRTSILIAHRLSTILAADEILVVKDGVIVERGVHAELVKAGGTYTELYETQFGKV